MSLTPAQKRVSTHWPEHARFHVVKCRSYRESRVLFEAAKKLGFRASWSGDLFILRRPSEDALTEVVEAGADRFLRGSNSYWKTPEETAKRRSFLRRWCPQALPAFDLIVARAYV